MANRHLARGTVLQALYEWDFGGKKSDIKDIFERDFAEFAQGSTVGPGQTGDRRFMEALIKGIVSKCSDLDVVIEKAAPDWPIDKISVMDRNILRLGLYELLFSDRGEVPPKVAIN